MKSIPLTPELERLVLCGMIGGTLPLSLVKPDELSKEGKAVWVGMKTLSEDLEQPQLYAYPAVFVAACEAGGGDHAEIKALLYSVKKLDPKEAAKVVGLVQRRALVLDLINVAGEQLASGEISPESLAEMLTSTPTPEPLKPIQVGNALPKPPEGFRIASLPGFSKRVGGQYGIWGICGNPGCGKTVLALQASVTISFVEDIPVLYYDFENGESTLLSRLGEAFSHKKDPLASVKAVTKKFYYRSSIDTLASDLQAVPPPAVIVIDSIHGLPLGADNKRTARLQQWIRRFEQIKLRGYGIILISEIPKSSFDAEPSQVDFKDTVDIIYKADLGMRILADGSYATVFVVKHRHRPVTGKVATFKRVRSWWFAEE